MKYIYLIFNKNKKKLIWYYLIITKRKRELFVGLLVGVMGLKFWGCEINKGLVILFELVMFRVVKLMKVMVIWIGDFVNWGLNLEKG